MVVCSLESTDNPKTSNYTTTVINDVRTKLCHAQTTPDITDALIDLNQLSIVCPLKLQHKTRISEIYGMAISNSLLPPDATVHVIKLMMHQNAVFDMNNLELFLWDNFFVKMYRQSTESTAIHVIFNAVSSLSAVIQAPPFNIYAFQIAITRYYVALIQRFSYRIVHSQQDLIEMIIRMIEQCFLFGSPYLDIAVWNEFFIQFYQCPHDLNNALPDFDARMIQLLDIQFLTPSKPNIRTFNRLLAGIAQSPSIPLRSDVIFPILNLMQSHGIEPDQENYRHQLRVFMKTKNTPKITEILVNHLTISNQTKQLIAEGGIAVINDVLEYLPICYPENAPMMMLILLNQMKPEGMLLDRKSYWILDNLREKYHKQMDIALYLQQIKQSSHWDASYGTVWQILQRVKVIRFGMVTPEYTNWLKMVPAEKRLTDPCCPPDIFVSVDEITNNFEPWTCRTFNIAITNWRTALRKYNFAEANGYKYVISNETVST